MAEEYVRDDTKVRQGTEGATLCSERETEFRFIVTYAFWLSDLVMSSKFTVSCAFELYLKFTLRTYDAL